MHGFFCGSVACLLVAGSASAAIVTIGGTPLPPDPKGIAQGLGSAEPNLSGEERFNTNPMVLTKLSGWIGRGHQARPNVRMQPEGDKSRFLSVKGTRKPVTLGFPIAPGETLEYIGFYWGSLDSYNFISFLDVNGNPVIVSGNGYDFGTEVSGEELAVLVGGYAPQDLEQTMTIPSLYANFYFTPAEQVNRIYIRQTNTAVEIDNVAWRVTGAPNRFALAADSFFAATAGTAASLVPHSASAVAQQVVAPAALALFGLGAGLIGIARRR